MFRQTALIAILLSLVCCCTVQALEPHEVLVIVNRRVETSERIARYYCLKRNVPEKNVLRLDLGRDLRDEIGRDEYDKLLALPIRQELRRRLPGDIRCLLTTYGVPISVGRRGVLPGMSSRFNELRGSIRREKQKLDQLEQAEAENGGKASARKKLINQKIAQMQLEADRISGKETNASVDSELSMVLKEPYELYRWQVNTLRGDALDLGYGTMMVSRLDGPDYDTIKGLIDKAVAAEREGLKGVAYLDSRGLVSKNVMGLYDKSLGDLADYLRKYTEIPVKEEVTAQLFAPGSCPDTALYCGWYKLRRYEDAFDFVDGAVGYHIASFEAQKLRDPNSTTWCAAMLRDGITATLGAVNEPYLHAFPNPRAFFPELLRGTCLVEAYYKTNPFNSWQLVLIGDPLYKPFGREK